MAGCLDHPQYKAKSRPKSSCARCREMYFARLEAEVAQARRGGKTYTRPAFHLDPDEGRCEDCARLEAEVEELKERLGGRERECDDYDKVLGNYMRAGEEADAKIEQLKAEVAELKADALWLFRLIDKDAFHSPDCTCSEDDMPCPVNVYYDMKERWRERGLLEDGDDLTDEITPEAMRTVIEGMARGVRRISDEDMKEGHTPKGATGEGDLARDRANARAVAVPSHRSCGHTESPGVLMPKTKPAPER